jgi:hypothetical protein
MPRTNQKRKKRHVAYNYMPSISPNPNFDKSKIDRLPKIFSNCDNALSQKDIAAIQVRLNFVDPNDLRRLHCLRVVNEDIIKLPSKESTTGCYYPDNGSNKAEIWLSYKLIKKGKGTEGLLNKLFYKDKLLETLFHEIGHHKASLIHSVDKYENEAYAEKYMLAYRKAWKSKFGPSKLYIIILKFTIKIVRYIVIGIIFPFRNMSNEMNLFYRICKGDINSIEFVNEYEKMTGSKENSTTDKKKSKWVHPLNKEKYLKRFRIPKR